MKLPNSPAAADGDANRSWQGRQGAHGGVESIIVGGVAAIRNGLGYTTYDLDVVYARDRGNIQKLVLSLEPYCPYLRGAPSGLPFKLDEGTVRMGLNFTLVTSFGDLNLLGEVTALPDFGSCCRCPTRSSRLACAAAGRTSNH